MTDCRSSHLGKIFGRFGYEHTMEYRHRIMYLMITLSILVAAFFLGLYISVIQFFPAILVHIIYILYSFTFFPALKKKRFFYVKIAMIVAHMTQLTLAVFVWYPVTTGFNLYYIMVPMVTFLTINYDDLKERSFAIVSSTCATLLFALSAYLSLPGMYETSKEMNRFLSSMGVMTILLPMTYIFTHFSKDLCKSHNDLKILASTDTLTQLHNRRVLYDTGVLDFALAKKYHDTFTLILFDIDLFKHINDQYGHPAGDEVLRQLATLVKSNIREEDVCARYGGEEFALLVHKDQESSVSIATKLLEVIRNQRFIVEEQVIQITVSIGITQYNERLKDFDHMMKIADKALYRAKSNGRNQIIIT